MDTLVKQILSHWTYGLCSIIATFVTLSAGLIGVFKWRYRNVPTSTPPESVDGVGTDRQTEPIVLRSNHCDIPEDFSYLRGRTVKVTGMVMHTFYDENPPRLQIHPFPFDVDANIRCEFAIEKARMIRRLEFLKLITVVGTAAEGIEVDIHRDTVELTLTNCRMETPPFLTWIRYGWHEFTKPFRWWWWMGTI